MTRPSKTQQRTNKLSQPRVCEHLCIIGHVAPSVTSVPWAAIEGFVGGFSSHFSKPMWLEGLVEDHPSLPHKFNMRQPWNDAVGVLHSLRQKRVDDIRIRDGEGVRAEHGFRLSIHYHLGSPHVGSLGCFTASVTTDLLACKGMKTRGTFEFVHKIMRALHDSGCVYHAFCEVGPPRDIQCGEVFGTGYWGPSWNFQRSVEFMCWRNAHEAGHHQSLRGVFPVNYISTKLISADKIVAFAAIFNKQAKQRGAGRGAEPLPDGSAIFWCVHSPYDLAFAVHPDPSHPFGGMAALLRKWLFDEGLMRY